MSKIEIFVRHCNFSSNSVGKNRPEGFSREACFINLLETSLMSSVNINVMFDGEPTPDHFINKYQSVNLIKKHGGNDAASFLNVLNHIKEQKLDPNTIVYILEDDYLHHPNWEAILRDGFDSLAADYVTLYDHKDKYFLSMYEQLASGIYISRLAHWRTTPSTTNTYACRYKTLMKHFDIHVKYCDLQRGYTRDHDKFTE